MLPKVVLIHPNHENCTDPRLDPPMGLLYIAAHLENNGVDVKICDMSGKEYWSIPYADVYGITVYISSIEMTRRIINICKITNPNAIIVVGGAHPSVCPDDFRDMAHHVVVGLGEQAMLDILMNRSGFWKVSGGEAKDPFIFPAYHKIDPSTYHRKIEGKTSLPYITSRGCPFQCTFCGLAGMHKLGKGVRMATPETVYEHIKRIKEEFGIDRINFQDDIFTFNPKRLAKILKLITPLDIKYRCMGRAGYDTEDTYKMLADSGCIQVSWGIESGSQYILDRMKKQVKVKDNYEVIQWAKKYGITSRGFFIIGFPGETSSTLRETKDFIECADPDQCFVSNFVPYPGTDVHDYAQSYGIISKSDNYDDYYQVSSDGTGGVTIDTEWLSRHEMRELELEFRAWLHKRHMRGSLQDYEIEMEALNEI